MDVNKKLIDSQVITEVLGIGSDIYIQSIKSFKDHRNIKELYKNSFSKWEKIFKNIYGYQITSELFLKHTYFAQILKVIAISKLSKYRNLNSEGVYNEYCKNELKHIFEYDFYSWIRFDEGIFRKIYN